MEEQVSLLVVRDFFMWCTIIDAALLLLSFLLLIAAGDFVYRMHSRWFPMPRETFNAVLYSFLEGFKVLVFVFNLVPYIALVILTKV